MEKEQFHHAVNHYMAKPIIPVKREEKDDLEIDDKRGKECS